MKKLLYEIKLFFCVMRLERLRKRAIKKGYCRPKNTCPFYPKYSGGVEIV